MEQTVGKKTGALSHWWHCDDSSDIVRGLLIMVVVFSTFSFAYFHHMNVLHTTLNDFEAPSTVLYVPTHITPGDIETKDLAVVEITDKAVLAGLDTNSAFHFVKQEEKDSTLAITHVIKPTNESTHAYWHKERLAIRSINFWMELVPKSVAYRNGQAIVKCNYEHSAAFVSFAFSFIFSAILAITLASLWEKRLKKRWTAKLRPE